MQPNVSFILEKTLYFVAHTTTLWLLLVLWLTAAASWYLSYALGHQTDRYQETILAKRIAAFYIVISLFLWLISCTFS